MANDYLKNPRTCTKCGADLFPNYMEATWEHFAPGCEFSGKSTYAGSQFNFAGSEISIMSTNNKSPVPTPSTQEIAKRGAAIYKQKYQQSLEQSSAGKFVAINVKTEEATTADTSEEAVRKGLEKDPQGLFHLVRVGHQSAFEAGWLMSYAR